MFKQCSLFLHTLAVVPPGVVSQPPNYSPLYPEMVVAGRTRRCRSGLPEEGPQLLDPPRAAPLGRRRSKQRLQESTRPGTHGDPSDKFRKPVGASNDRDTVSLLDDHDCTTAKTLYSSGTQSHVRNRAGQDGYDEGRHHSGHPVEQQCYATIQRSHTKRKKEDFSDLQRLVRLTFP